MSALACSLRFVAVAALLGSPFASAAGRVSDAQAVYQADRAACLKGESHQDRATCMREAAAALQEARRNGLTDEASQYERNRLARCDAQPPADRQECVRRMNEGTVSGSVKGGGIYRELTTTVPSR